MMFLQAKLDIELNGSLTCTWYNPLSSVASAPKSNAQCSDDKEPDERGTGECDDDDQGLYDGVDGAAEDDDEALAPYYDNEHADVDYDEEGDFVDYD